LGAFVPSRGESDSPWGTDRTLISGHEGAKARRHEEQRMLWVYPANIPASRVASSRGQSDSSWGTDRTLISGHEGAKARRHEVQRMLWVHTTNIPASRLRAFVSSRG